MQLIKRILTHPGIVCILFCFIIISGESTGYFYLTLLMLGLSHGLLHSILGIGGLLLIAFGSLKKNSASNVVIRLLGSVCLLLSLIRFFTQPGGSYNYNTFREGVPLILLIVFCIVLVVFIFNQCHLLLHKRENVSSLI